MVSNALANVTSGSIETSWSPNEKTVRPSVLAVRHGLTQWNADQRWQGWADIPLSPMGVRQAEVGARTLAGLLAEDGRQVRIVASDLLRARQTAEYFALALGIGIHEIESRTGLRERNVGAWSGKTGREIEQRWPGMLQAWRDGVITETPEGENEEGFQARIGQVMAEFAHTSAFSGEVVILVSHGGVIRTFERMVGLEPEPVGNVSGRWFGVVTSSPNSAPIDTSNASPFDGDHGVARLSTGPSMAAVRGFDGVDLLSDDLLARFARVGGGEPIERTVGNAL